MIAFWFTSVCVHKTCVLPITVQYRTSYVASRRDLMDREIEKNNPTRFTFLTRMEAVDVDQPARTRDN